MLFRTSKIFNYDNHIKTHEKCSSNAANVIEHKFCSASARSYRDDTKNEPRSSVYNIYIWRVTTSEIRDSIDMQNNGVTGRCARKAKIVLRRSRECEKSKHKELKERRRRVTSHVGI